MDRFRSFSRFYVLFAALGGCAVGPRATEDRVLEAEHSPQSGVRATTRNGGVDVRVDESATRVEVVARITTEGHTDAEARDRLSRTEIRLERDQSGWLLVEPLFPDEPRGGDGCDFQIRVPSASGVHARSSNGRIRVVGARGDVDLETSNGGVVVRGCSGSVSVATSNGGIEVEAASGDVDARTSNGGIELSGVPGRVSAETSNGGISLRSAPDRVVPFSLVTSNGRVEVELPGAPRLAVECRTSNGGIDVLGSAAVEITGSETRKRVVIGGGGAEAIVRTSNGSVTIRAGG